ncbi:MAG TPA: nodulation protein NfeD [Luteibacter sp.]|jgi:membrane-bound serine protease (ClpP class)|nr:nodulation protein NfeD [Luteibacter sp.]
MTRWLAWFAFFLALAIPGQARTGTAPISPPSTGMVAQIDLDGPIGPASAEYFADAYKRAIDDGAVAIVLRLDTPGGLADSMRRIVAAILASKLPVLGYVAPGGARAASAGTYILYACHIAAMAPATHLGAATPVTLGGRTPMPPTPPDNDASSKKPDGEAAELKSVNDAVAYIRSLAQLRGRNADWAETAVRGAATLTASEAAGQHVIDIVAVDVPGLLALADGRSVRVGEQDSVLRIKGLPLRDYAPNWRTRFLGIITQPTIAYVLLLAGLYGLILEALHPGALLPGIGGGISLLIGLYALQLLPVNYAGLALMALGVGLLLAELVSPSIGALGIGGVIAFVVGSIMLMDTGVPGYGINMGAIAAIALCAAALLALIVSMAARSRRSQRVSGDEQMLDADGELLEPVNAGGEAWARVRGERWRVCSEVSLPAGARVRIVRRTGLLLWVAPR